VVLMAADPLDKVLQLVAEGRLTAEEAAPILAALDEQPDATNERGARPATAAGGAARSGRDEPPGGFGLNPPPDFADAASWGSASEGAPRSLRIEVREGGRQVVNLRLPIAVGRFALDRVPGLSGDQVERVREALSSGLRGPVLTVDDGDSGVRIVLD